MKSFDIINEIRRRIAIQECGNTSIKTKEHFSKMVFHQIDLIEHELNFLHNAPKDAMEEESISMNDEIGKPFEARLVHNGVTFSIEQDGRGYESKINKSQAIELANWILEQTK